jgi:hypothetical protein
MPQMISQAVFKPNPGADMAKMVAIVTEAAVIWRKHGAEVSVWTVSRSVLQRHRGHNGGCDCLFGRAQWLWA